MGEDVSETEGAADGFTRTAADYDEIVRHNIMGARRLVMSLPDAGYERALDVGCGTGFSSLAMVERFGCRELVGVDPAQGMLDQFAEKIRDRDDTRFHLLAEDVMDMSVADDSFDAVISSMAFHWFEDKPAAMARMARAARPGGVVAVLQSGRGGEETFRRALAGIDPPVPAKWMAAFDAIQRDVDELEAYFRAARLEPIDVWMERRRRCTPVDAFRARTRVVASHLASDLPDDEREALGERVERAIHEAATPEGFAYDFTKLFGIARKPA
jgi:SAM-dependent methyltransferase